MHFIRAGGHRLEYRWVLPHAAETASDRPVLVLLHEGLGSVALWKRFPDAVADATGVRFAHLPLTADRIFEALGAAP